MPDIARDASLQNIQHYAITDNPVFKVKIRSLKTDFEQDANKSNDNPKKVLKLGDMVSGNGIKKDKNYTGKIISLNKVKDNIIVIVDEDSGEKISLYADSCNKIKKKDNSGYKHLNFYAENRIIKYKEFKKFLNND